MTDMVERVARAIEVHTAGAKWTPEGLARAAIEAMREPTQSMVTACWPLHHPWGEHAPDPSERTLMFDDMAADVAADWQAMIDAALKP